MGILVKRESGAAGEVCAGRVNASGTSFYPPIATTGWEDKTKIL